MSDICPHTSAGPTTTAESQPLLECISRIRQITGTQDVMLADLPEAIRQRMTERPTPEQVEAMVTCEKRNALREAFSRLDAWAIKGHKYTCGTNGGTFPGDGFYCHLKGGRIGLTFDIQVDDSEDLGYRDEDGDVRWPTPEEVIEEAMNRWEKAVAEKQESDRPKVRQCGRGL